MSFRKIRTAAVLAVLLVLVNLLGAMSAAAQVSGVQEVKLDNGLTVLMKEVHAAPVFTAQVWFKVGSRNEYTGITGTSHLLEHMLFNSSKNYKKGEISKMVRERGGIDNAATWTDFTYYWELLSKDHLEFALQTLAERLGNALLLPEELEKERTVVLSELEGRENDPGTLLYQEVMAAAFKASPYQWPVIGWKSDVQNVSREQVAEYYKAHYHPNNATLVLVGDFDSAQVLELVKKHFGSLPAGELPRPVYTTEPPQNGRRDVVLRREGNAERLILGYHAPAISDPDAYPLMILDQILSGGRSSRLYQALVEKQLATSAWSSASLRTAPSLFLLGATARQGVDADTLEKALLEQVELVKTTLPTEEEMKAAKNQLEAYFIFQNDSVSDQGEQLGYYATVADWRYLETFLPRLKAVTAEEVQAVAVKYLQEDKLTAGRFLPTAPAPNAPAPPATGPVHNSMTPDASDGLAYYRQPVAGEEDSVTEAAAGAGPNSLVKPHRTVLDNGMVVIVQENPANATIAISGNLKAGSCFDPEDKSGTAELTAEMVQRGTEKRSALQIAQESEYVGASIDISAGVESVNFSARALTKDFSLMLDLISDQLRNANFPQEQFEKSKGEMLSRLEQSKESTDAMAFRTFYNKVFPKGHPYHELLIEQATQEMRSITREDLVEFHKQYYRPDTAVITIVGDVKADEAVEAVRKYFGDWKAQGPTPRMEIPTVSPQQQPASTVIPMPDKSEVNVVFGHALGIRRQDPDYYAVRVMNQILGGAGALASILGEEIREKRGLVYNVYSTFDAGIGAGPWYTTLGTNPNNVKEAVDTVKAQIKQFQEQGATKEEFERAREFIIGVFPIALETNSGVARTLLNAEFYGLGMDYLQNYDDIYRAVTLEQVNAAAKKYLHPDSATLVIAGPYEGK